MRFDHVNYLVVRVCQRHYVYGMSLYIISHGVQHNLAPGLGITARVETRTIVSSRVSEHPSFGGKHPPSYLRILNVNSGKGTARLYCDCKIIFFDLIEHPIQYLMCSTLVSVIICYS